MATGIPRARGLAPGAEEVSYQHGRDQRAVPRPRRAAVLHVVVFVPLAPLLQSRPLFRPRRADAAARPGAPDRGWTCILVPNELTDAVPIRLAGHSYFDDLLSAGVRIFEYQPAMMHNKTVVVDGQWSVVGSANMDIRSTELNQENVLGILDEGFGREGQAAFLADLEKAREIKLPEWRRRGVGATRIGLRPVRGAVLTLDGGERPSQRRSTWRTIRARRVPVPLGYEAPRPLPGRAPRRPKCRAKDDDGDRPVAGLSIRRIAVHHPRRGEVHIACELADRSGRLGPLRGGSRCAQARVFGSTSTGERCIASRQHLMAPQSPPPPGW